MKRMVRLLAVLSMMIGCFSWFGLTGSASAAPSPNFILQSSPVLLAEADASLRNSADDKLSTDFGKKIDLNNTNVRAFRKYPGMYPNLARKVVDNAPYKSVEAVLDIPGLSDHQKELLQANIDKFAVTNVEKVFNEGGDRYNNGIY